MTELHDTAARGFDAGAGAYERARPGYPPACVDYLIDGLEDRQGGLVLDLAAGTGKLARELVARGIECVAVEPVAGMRAAFEQALPGTRVLDGTAEAIPLADASVAAVVVAQAFHWFRQDEALAEIHRVLRPEGRLAIVWNVRDESHDWVARLTDLIAPYEGAGGVRIPRHRDQTWKRALEGSPLFCAVSAASFPHDRETTPEGLLDRVASISFVAVLPEPRRAGVMDEVRALTRSHPDLAGRERFTFPYVCDASVYVRV